MDLKKAEHFAIRDLFTGLTVHSISSDLTMTALQTTFPPPRVQYCVTAGTVSDE